MKVLSLFSGIGAFEKALDNLGVPYELVNFCEFDEQAVKSYCAIHSVDESKNLGDITKVDENALANDIDVLTYGFPCQDISSSGKQKGFFNEDGTQTRSGLFFDALRIITAAQPKVAIAENVKALTSAKLSKEFEAVLAGLKEAGYTNHWKVLKASDLGTPQARERVFIVSIRNDLEQGDFEFPAPCGLQHSLAELADFREQDDLTPAFYNRYRETKSPSASVEDFLQYIERLPVRLNDIHTKKLDMYSFAEMNTITLLTGVTGTLTCRNVINYNKKYLVNGRLFRPSPKMCFRLMGFDDNDFDKAVAVTDEANLYKQAGNSIVVSVAEKLLAEVLKVIKK